MCLTLSSFTWPPLAFVWAGEKSTKNYWHDLQIKAVYSKEGIVTTVIFYHYWTVFEISSFLNRKLFMCREYTIWFVLSTPSNITTDFFTSQRKTRLQFFFNVHCKSWTKSNITNLTFFYIWFEYLICSEYLSRYMFWNDLIRSDTFITNSKGYFLMKLDYKVPNASNIW